MSSFWYFLCDRGSVSESFGDSDDYVRIVLPSDYPESKIVERLYVAAGLLPKREDMTTYNRQEIAAYNERHPEHPISPDLYVMQ
jgi:hypothetical protein